MKSVFRTVKSDPSWAFFLAFAFLAGVSMPLARIALPASIVFTLANRDRRRGLRLTGPTAGWLLYLALAVAVTGAASFGAIQSSGWFSLAMGCLFAALALPLGSQGHGYEHVHAVEEAVERHLRGHHAPQVFSCLRTVAIFHLVDEVRELRPCLVVEEGGGALHGNLSP